MNALFPPAGQTPNWETTFPAPGTDPWMACNAFDYRAASGKLKDFQGKIISGGEKVPAEADLGFLLRATVISTLLAQKKELAGILAQQWLGIPVVPEVQGPEPNSVGPEAREKDLRLARCKAVDASSEKGKNMGYTSRPLNGVWATPPFLHNGSVPSMYELLLPVEERAQFAPRMKSSTETRQPLPPAERDRFYLGSREYNPVDMGLVTAKSDQNVFEFKIKDASGKPVYGNSNAGHDYGNAAFTDAQRYAIIEYLKTLGDQP